VEPLKMLKGTAIRKSAGANGYSFSPYPPYRILRSSWLTFEDICRIEEISESVEEIYNSGRYRVTLEILARQGSLLPFFTAQRPAHTGTRQLSQAFAELLAVAADNFSVRSEIIRDTLRFDYCMSGHPGKRLPAFLQPSGEENGLQARAMTNKEVAARLSLPDTIQFRTFTTTFARNYSVAGWPEGVTTLLFAYGNFAGAKKVLLLSV
jgi:anaerobic magnesium-protoporphyrin IX monomethyl ester cyclase